MSYKMQDLYTLCGISKQAHAQALLRQEQEQSKAQLYLGLLEHLREMHPGMGLRKMYEQFKPEGIGRDAFIALGLAAGFRLRVVSNPLRTTWAYKRNAYPNLLGGKRFTDVNQVWASDISYFSLLGQHYYLVFLMDVYSRKIVGYSVEDHLRTENNLAALQKALNLRAIPDFKKALIHHSDRGTQYISEKYTQVLQDYNIAISMCKDVLENAHIERVNGTIKNEYLYRWNIQSPKELKKYLKKAVENYNNRAHYSLQMKTPNEFEEYIQQIPKENRPVLEIFTLPKQTGNNTNQVPIFE